MGHRRLLRTLIRHLQEQLLPACQPRQPRSINLLKVHRSLSRLLWLRFRHRPWEHLLDRCSIKVSRAAELEDRWAPWEAMDHTRCSKAKHLLAWYTNNLLKVLVVLTASLHSSQCRVNSTAYTPWACQWGHQCRMGCLSLECRLNSFLREGTEAILVFHMAMRSAPASIRCSIIHPSK